MDCAYAELWAVFATREWNPVEAGYVSRDVETSEDAAATAGRNQGSISISFVNETPRVESNYTIIPADKHPSDPASSPSASLSHRTPTYSNLQSPAAAVSSPHGELQPSFPLIHPITSPADAFFMNRYCTVIGPWFDLFDVRRRRFSLEVPHLALQNRLLLLSAMACAARQHHLTSSQPVKTALTYYDEALQLLGSSLKDFSRSSSAAVFASCLLLAHCEMIGASTRDWHLHLSGALSLVTTYGWHRCTDGLGQACLWIYYRMDILSSLATAESTRLQTNLWDTTGDGVRWTIESWSNHAVLLLAEVHNLLCDVREGNGSFATLLERWQKLGSRIEQHEQSQPLEFQPLAVLDAEPTSNEQNPFPSVLYINEAVSAAMQTFDLARLLHILARPERSHQERAARLVRNGEIQAEIFVVRVIANSIANRGAINWVNAVQLLHTAGMALVGWLRRKALLRCLEDIQAETGWNTRHNIDALLEWWGWAAPLRQRGQTWREVHEEIGPRQRIGDFLLRMFESKDQTGRLEMPSLC
ncbi:hypothetical protein VTN77DRAFT_7042 [Rasamsonia byssochlamydoides]|uniref:uncharacterized protein n=1 Tax=Rasamsonia byssochlamydoides TaxID=89139 RepID=UPI003743FA41